jgi:L-alanine-DL-glutamate epimerase-like enolase superfamily enzyme
VIERIETFTREEASVLRVVTDEGDAGIGQLAPGGHRIAAQVLHEIVAPRALGEDEDDIWGLVDHVMERTYKYPGTFVLRGLCGLDTALWDLKGKREDRPVCELLGGPADPDPVAAYGSRLRRDTDPEEEVEICSQFRDRGLEAFKLKIGKRLAFHTDEDVYPGRTEAVVSAVRGALGDDVDLLVDANSAYSAEGAIEVGETVLEPNGVIHFEEPCPYWELDWTATVREALDVPVAGGEQDNMLGQWAKQWERIVGMPAVDVVQPDVGYVGGIARAMRVAELAAEAGLPVVPHGPNHTLQKVFTLHLLAAIDNTGPYPFEYRIPDTGGHGMYDPEPVVEDGSVPVPTDAPGWGVTVDEEWLARTEYAVSER